MDTNKQVYNSRVRGLNLFLAMGVTVAPIAFGLLLVMLYAPGGERRLAAAFVLGGLALAVAGGLWMTARGPFIIIRWLRPRVRRKVEAVHTADVREALFVGLSPGSEVRNYNGDTAWDVGFLTLEPGRMRYLGDISSFELSPEQVESVTDATVKFVGMKLPRAMVEWRESPEGSSQVFVLEDWNVGSLAECKRRVGVLTRQIESWRRGGYSSYSFPNRLGLPPPSESVKSVPLHPGVQVGWQAMLLSLAVVCAAVAVVTFLAVRFLGRGEDTARALRHLSIPVAILCFWSLSRWFQKRLDRRNKDNQ